MSAFSIFAQFVALIGGVALRWRKLQGAPPQSRLGQQPSGAGREAAGRDPYAQDADSAGLGEGAEADAAPGLKVNAFAAGLEHPRWIEVLPNGDVLVAESMQTPARSGACSAMRCTRRCGAPSARRPDRITLLRDTDGDGAAETRSLHGATHRPFGMALRGETFYVGNTDGVVAFPTRRVPTASRRRDAARSSSPAGTGRAAWCSAPMETSSMPASAR